MKCVILRAVLIASLFKLILTSFESVITRKKSSLTSAGQFRNKREEVIRERARGKGRNARARQRGRRNRGGAAGRGGQRGARRETQESRVHAYATISFDCIIVSRPGGIIRVNKLHIFFSIPRSLFATRPTASSVPSFHCVVILSPLIRDDCLIPLSRFARDATRDDASPAR